MLTSFINKLCDIFGSKQWAPYPCADGLVMRRRLPGRWEFRSPTTRELEEQVQWQAIK